MRAAVPYLRPVSVGPSPNVKEGPRPVQPHHGKLLSRQFLNELIMVLYVMSLGLLEDGHGFAYHLLAPYHG